ncbi:MAG: DNA methyltransferase [Pirellulaceae bacterium]
MNQIALAKLASPETNRVMVEDRPVHDWYRFVLSYPPHLVRTYLEKFGVGQNQTVLDPFCGTGTTLVETKKRGIASVGIEANPMAFFATNVKLNWLPSPQALQGEAEEIARVVREEYEAIGIADGDVDSDEPSLFANGIRRRQTKEKATLRRFDAEQDRLILTNSISSLPLHKTLVLHDAIVRMSSGRNRSHLRLALAKAVVFSISNLHFGPEVGVTKPKKDAPVLDSWLNAVTGITRDLRLVKKLPSAQSTVFRADARAVSELLQPKSIDVVITSPPYPNEKDYTRTTRLESVILGFLHDKASLRNLKREMLRSNTRGVYRLDDDDKWVADHPEVQRLATAIEARRLELGKTSGFERLYHRVTKLYFGGMARHFSELTSILRPGARLAYVVGDQASYLRVMIRTGTILADIAESLGYRVLNIDLFRTRLATATKEQLREEVVLLEWPGAQRNRGGSKATKKRDEKTN